MDAKHKFSDIHIDRDPQEYDQFVFVRGISGLLSANSIFTNVPHLVVHHSPDGFQFGYGGSGPADLALNILEYTLASMGHTGENTNCYSGKCFLLAWKLHQKFKWEMIATMHSAANSISYTDVVKWIESQIEYQDEEKRKTGRFF